MRTQMAQAIVITSTNLGIFNALDQDSFSSTEDVAKKCGIQIRAAELVLNALAGMGLLEKKVETYRNLEEAQHYLRSDSPLYMGKFIDLRPKLAESWLNLGAVLKSGVPHSEVNKEDKAEEFFPELAAALFPINFAYAQNLSDVLGIESRREKTRVLDLACGSAVWSIPMAQANKNVKVDALDFPAVLERTTKA